MDHLHLHLLSSRSFLRQHLLSRGRSFGAFGRCSTIMRVSTIRVSTIRVRQNMNQGTRTTSPERVAGTVRRNCWCTCQRAAGNMYERETGWRMRDRLACTRSGSHRPGWRARNGCCGPRQVGRTRAARAARRHHPRGWSSSGAMHGRGGPS